MVDLKELQKAVYENKVARGWNVTDMCREFCQLEAEVSEAFQAYFNEPRENFAEELADVAIVAKVVSWEYNDAGFSGFYDRDEMTISIKLERVATKRILARHTVEVNSSFRILAKYVDGL